jgi:hypothetical protein
MGMLNRGVGLFLGCISITSQFRWLKTITREYTFCW